MPDQLIVVGTGNAEQVIGGLVGAETKTEVVTTQLDEINQSVMLTQRRQFAFVGLGHRGYIKVPVAHDEDTLLDYIKLKIKRLWKQG
jgi:5-keto 4-deoxyuronate isomerase